MTARFYAPDAHAPGDLIELPQEEAEHLVRVLRLGAGDMVSVFDGRGHEYLARVISAVRRDAIDARMELTTPAVEDRDLVAGAETQHLRQVARLIRAKMSRRGGSVDHVGEKPWQHSRKS